MKMHYLVLAALLVSSVGHAAEKSDNTAIETTTQSIARAQQIITDVADAYGGRERIMALPVLRQSYRGSYNAVEQSPGTEPPWEVNELAGDSLIDVQTNRFMEREFDPSDAYDYDYTRLVVPEQSYQIDYRAGTASELSDVEYSTASAPYQRVTPVLLVRQLLQNAHRSHALRPRTVNGEQTDSVTLVMDTGPVISLHFDRQSHLLIHSERVLPGAGLVEYRFGDYHKVDGIPFNRSFKLVVDGSESNERSDIATVFVNDAAAADSGFSVNKSLRRLAASQPDAVESGPISTEISEGVHLIGEQGTYALFVEMQDHVIAVGGTAGITERMNVQRQQNSSKPIRYGVMTHHHADHVLGAADYAAAGVTVVAAAAHEKPVRAAMNHSDAELKTVDRSLNLSDKTRKVQLLDVGPTVHSENLLVAWLPEQGILFQADHFGLLPGGGVSPASSSTRSFAEALKRHNIKPKVILSAHSADSASAKQFQAALRLKPRPRPTLMKQTATTKVAEKVRG